MLTLMVNNEKHETTLEYMRYDYLKLVYTQLKNDKNTELLYTDPYHGFTNDYLLVKDQHVCVVDFIQNEKLCRIYNGELISILFADEKKEYRNTLKQLFNVSDENFVQRLLEYYDLHYTSAKCIMNTSKISLVKIMQI